MSKDDKIVPIIGFILAFVVFAIIVVLFLNMNAAWGFFHDHNDKPPKPELKLLNPTIMQELDNLYNKYPHIYQTDIDNSHALLVQDCMDYQQEDDGNNNIFGSFICSGITTGVLQGYLEQLGMQLEPSTAEYGNVGKAPQLWTEASKEEVTN